MRYLATISYDGSIYNGYQKQKNKLTIQEELENALTQINSNIKVKVFASGRTDAKVHALNQTAHFDLNYNLAPEKIQKSINQLLNPAIYVKKIVIVDDKFHARFDVKKKEYVYKINIGEYNPLDRNYIYQYNKYLDIEKMLLALKKFKGSHNFRAFTKVEEEKDFIRTIYDIDIQKVDNIILINITGNGFLRYMVRNIVGLLIEIGSGKKQVADVKNIINSMDRTMSGIIAPPQGLYLNMVIYDKDL